jgi:hypothetical protein
MNPSISAQRAKRAQEAAEIYWTDQLSQNPAIHSFKIYELGNKWDGNHWKLVGRMMEMRSRLLKYGPGEDVEMLEEYFGRPSADADMSIAILQEEFFRRRQRIVKNNR